MVHIGNSWDELLQDEFKKEYYLKLREFLKKEYSTYRVYPDMNDIFNALKLTDYNDVKVVILGQDPYHEPGQAHGLSFSVKPGVTRPPSLRNIYKELQDDIGFQIPESGYLEKWAREGVLLLNACLTVRKGEANSHQNQGWEIFTDRVIEILAKREKPMVFMLWGSYARAKKKIIGQGKHLILEAPHPSPLSAHRGFMGCRHFSKANQFLKQQGLEPVDWQL